MSVRQYDALISKSLNAMIRVDYRLTGPTWFHVVQAQTNPTIFGVPGDYSGTRRDAYGIFDVRAGISGGEMEPDGLWHECAQQALSDRNHACGGVWRHPARPAPARNTGWN
jgi:hypothetical protein